MRAAWLSLLLALPALADEPSPPTAISVDLSGPIQTLAFRGSTLPVLVELERKLVGPLSFTLDGRVDFSIRGGALTTRYGAHLGLRLFPLAEGIDSFWLGLRLGTAWESFWTGEAILGAGYTLIFAKSFYLSPGIEFGANLSRGGFGWSFPLWRLHVGTAF